MLIGYARVSTDQQDHALQIDALNAAGCERIFVETGSGSRSDRPELAKALDMIRDGDCLVVWRLDRAARSLKQLIEIAATLRERGVALKSINESIDTSTANGRFLFHVLGSLAEMELEILRERTRAGLAAAAARGRKGGRPRALDDAQIRAAKAMMMTDLTTSEICRQLQCSPSTLFRHLPGGRSALQTVAAVG
jgi:DNA invertase Pin-like site-specific DNA recombinase